MILGQPLALECNVTAVRGINSKIYIQWHINGVLEINNSVKASMTNSGFEVFNDSFDIPQLTTNDNGVVYECEVIIYTDPPVRASHSLTLNVTGKSL